MPHFETAPSGQQLKVNLMKDIETIAGILEGLVSQDAALVGKVRVDIERLPNKFDDGKIVLVCETDELATIIDKHIESNKVWRTPLKRFARKNSRLNLATGVLLPKHVRDELQAEYNADQAKKGN